MAINVYPNLHKQTKNGEKSTVVPCCILGLPVIGLQTDSSEIVDVVVLAIS